MTIPKSLLLFCILYALSACEPVANTGQAGQETLAPATEPASAAELPITIDLTSAELQYDTTIVVPDDGFFKTKKEYRGYPLSRNLAPIIAGLADTVGLVLTFVCSDGYTVSMPYATLNGSEAFLAYRDLEAKGDWFREVAAKFPPYYLVWPEWSGDVKQYPWPYGLLEIRITRFLEEFAAAIPQDPAVEKGFHLFTGYCIKCHSINQVGGNLGPEFNYPKNITEYWAKEDIWSFAKNPQAYRYNSKMPPVADLNREEFEEVYRYLLAMKKQKSAGGQ